MVVFRCELMAMYFPIFVYEWWKGNLNMKSTILWGLQASMVSLVATVSFDSWFWRRWLWPEYQVWYFNAVLNQSRRWGTKPFHYYFGLLIPRAFLFNLPTIFYGLWKAPKRRAYGVIMLLFIFIYSFLPHKEMRFIMYTFPLFCMYGAWGWTCVYQKAKKSIMAKIICVFLSLMVFWTFLTCLFSLFISFNNYPGGTAMLLLHRIIPKNDSGKSLFG